MLPAFRITLFILLLSASMCNAQNSASGYNLNFGILQPRSSFATEAYRNGWTVGGRYFMGADIINVQLGGGFEMWQLKKDAASTNPMMDSIIKDNGGDPTSTTFMTLGVEVGTPANFPVRFSVLAEGDVGIYFGKSVYVMRQMRRDPMVHPIHWSAGFSLTSRLDFRIMQDEDAAVFLFVQAGFRGHPGQIQKNRFLLGSIGISVWRFA